MGWKDSELIRQIKNSNFFLPKVYFPKKLYKFILEANASDNSWGCVLKAIPEKYWQKYEQPYKTIK